MPKRRLRTAIRWTLTLLVVALVGTFLYGLGHILEWDRSDGDCQVLLWRARVCISWRPPDYDPNMDPVRSSSVWSIIPDDYPIVWRFTSNRDAKWQNICIPIWWPGLIAITASAGCWYVDRHRVASRWRRLKEWSAPTRPSRPRLWKTAIFAGLHLVVSVSMFSIFDIVKNLILYGEIDDDDFLDLNWFAPLMLAYAIVGVLPFPFWAVLWARLWIRWRNHLLRRYHPNICDRCGYDLTGNTSGRCPECGATRAAALEAAIGK